MKRSKNLKEFYMNTKERFKGKAGIAILATLISVFPFMIVLCAAAWLSQFVSGMFATIAIIALVAYGCAQVGHIRFIRLLAANENPSLAVLYSGYKDLKKTPFYLFIGVVLLIIYLISGLLLVVPLFFMIGMFSMVFYFVEHHNYETVIDALSKTEKRMRRQKGNMFAYKGLFYIAYLLLFILFVIGVVFSLRIKAVAVCVTLLVLLHLALYVVFSIITTYFSFSNFNFFMEVLEYHERMGKKPASPEIPSAEKKEEPVDIKKVSMNEKVEVKKVSTTTRKAPVAKKTTTDSKAKSAASTTTAKKASASTTAKKAPVAKKTAAKDKE